MKNLIFQSFAGNNIFPFLLFILLSGINVQAATITWAGGTGNWSDKNNWDSGTVPEVNDHVFIPSGQVTTEQGSVIEITSLTIGSAATFTNNISCTIFILNANGYSAINNNGKIINNGHLDCKNITQNSQAEAGNGIYNNGTFHNNAGGSIQVANAEKNGIDNTTSGKFYNFGHVDMFYINGSCIYNRYAFYNYNYIELRNVNYITQVGITNTKVFVNYSTAAIWIDGADNGIDNVLDGRVYNWGDIFLTNQEEKAVFNYGKMYNYSNGWVGIENSGLAALDNGNKYINYGTTIINGAGSVGVSTTGELYNLNTLSITEIASTGLVCWPGGYVINSGKLYISDCGIQAIQVQGKFENSTTGAIEIDNGFNLFGNLINEGIFSTSNSGSSQSGTNFHNFGILVDPFESIASVPINEELVLQPFTGNLQNGVPYPNFLNVNNGDMVKYHGIYYNSTATKKAGDYDAKYNIFTPNSMAIGQSQLYVVVSIEGTNNVKICSLPLSNSIITYVSHPGNDFAGDFSDLAIENNSSKLRVFPNPTDGAINLQSKLFDTESTSIEIYNVIGQKVYAEQFDQYAQPILFLNESLANGIYFIRCMQAEKNVAAQRIQLQR